MTLVLNGYTFRVPAALYHQAFFALIAVGASLGAQQPTAAPYWPTTDAAWERRAPSAAGFDSVKLAAAIDLARRLSPPHRLGSVEEWDRMLVAVHRQTGEVQPENIGRLELPLGLNGLIMRRGYIVAEFGDIRTPEITASLTKSILSTVAGVAWDRELIALDEPVVRTVTDGGYASAHNAKITWRHHLEQTSEWEGTLFGMPDVNDRRGPLRAVPIVEPGTRFGYNDVRVNRLSLSLLRRFGRPLPDVLREHVMEPIGASASWSWHGYRTSTVDVNGRQIESVSGGAHWGGGFYVNAYDLARIGLMYARGGRWRDRQVLSREWIALATTPSAVTRGYGFLWWLNSTGALAATGPATGYAMMGGGGFYCWVDAENDLVVVIKSLGGNRPELQQVLDAIYASFSS